MAPMKRGIVHSRGRGKPWEKGIYKKGDGAGKVAGSTEPNTI